MNYERLYLNEKIYIDENTNLLLDQDQRAVIRFLYNSSVQKRPGVIINSSREIAAIDVILFLKAVPYKPVLILTNCIDQWRDVCTEWIPDYDEIIFDSLKIHKTVKIYINNLEDLEMMVSKNDWGFVVVDCDDYGSKMFNRLSIVKTPFRIVISPLRFIDHIGTLMEMYKWLYPGELSSIKLYSSLIDLSRNNMEKMKYMQILFEGVISNWYNNKFEKTNTTKEIINKTKKMYRNSQLDYKDSTIRASTSSLAPQIVIEDDTTDNVTMFSDEVATQALFLSDDDDEKVNIRSKMDYNEPTIKISSTHLNPQLVIEDDTSDNLRMFSDEVGTQSLLSDDGNEKIKFAFSLNSEDQSLQNDEVIAINEGEIIDLDHVDEANKDLAKVSNGSNTSTGDGSEKKRKLDNNVDDKAKQLEEDVLKRFKGSILDRIF